MNFGAAILPQEAALYDIKQISGTPAQLLGIYLNDLGVKGSSKCSFGPVHERELQIYKEPWPLSKEFIGFPQRYAPGQWHYSEVSDLALWRPFPSLAILIIPIISIVCARDPSATAHPFGPL